MSKCIKRDQHWCLQVCGERTWIKATIHRLFFFNQVLFYLNERSLLRTKERKECTLHNCRQNWPKELFNSSLFSPPSAFTIPVTPWREYLHSILLLIINTHIKLQTTWNHWEDLYCVRWYCPKTITPMTNNTFLSCCAFHLGILNLLTNIN